jgi:hypothetical protein
MHEERFFCAAESRANDEAIYGTVALIRSWLLLEYPRAWRKNALEDSRMLSPELKTHIRRLPVDRALLIRQDYRRAELLRCFFVNACEDPPVTSRYTIPDYDGLRNLQGNGEQVDTLMFAVCTHGRHDMCCAKFGIPVWCAFRDLAGERAWQCSHVGGDRFAGNVVVFPYGIYYGRVLPEDVPEILRRSDAGKVWLPGYRGRSCFPRAVQVAEYFARLESGRLRIDEFRPLAVERVAVGNTRVTFQARSDRTLHVVEFMTRTDALHQRLTCEATEQSAIAQYELRTYKAYKQPL